PVPPQLGLQLQSHPSWDCSSSPTQARTAAPVPPKLGLQLQSHPSWDCSSSPTQAGTAAPVPPKLGLQLQSHPSWDCSSSPTPAGTAAPVPPKLGLQLQSHPSWDCSSSPAPAGTAAPVPPQLGLQLQSHPSGDCSSVPPKPGLQLQSHPSWDCSSSPTPAGTAAPVPPQLGLQLQSHPSWDCSSSPTPAGTAAPVPPKLGLQLQSHPSWDCSSSPTPAGTAAPVPPKQQQLIGKALISVKRLEAFLCIPTPPTAAPLASAFAPPPHRLIPSHCSCSYHSTCRQQHHHRVSQLQSAALALPLSPPPPLLAPAPPRFPLPLASHSPPAAPRPCPGGGAGGGAAEAARLPHPLPATDTTCAASPSPPLAVHMCGLSFSWRAPATATSKAASAATGESVEEDSAAVQEGSGSRSTRGNSRGSGIALHCIRLDVPEGAVVAIVGKVTPSLPPCPLPVLSLFHIVSTLSLCSQQLYYFTCRLHHKRPLLLHVTMLIWTPAFMLSPIPPLPARLQVGSGKSSLLAAILGEMQPVPTHTMPCTHAHGAAGLGNARPHGVHRSPRSAAVLQPPLTCSFPALTASPHPPCSVHQEPWVFAGSIRDNVLFGAPWDPIRYQQVMHACALHEDTAAMAGGNEAGVADRGLTLSGGQRARLALARALYSDATLLLLDDPLSALDARVARHVSNAALFGPIARGRTILLCTHSPPVLPLAPGIPTRPPFQLLLSKPCSAVQRSSLVVAMQHGRIVHAAPPAARVPALMLGNRVVDSDDTCMNDGECMDADTCGLLVRLLGEQQGEQDEEKGGQECEGEGRQCGRNGHGEGEGAAAAREEAGQADGKVLDCSTKEGHGVSGVDGATAGAASEESRQEDGAPCAEEPDREGRGCSGEGKGQAGAALEEEERREAGSVRLSVYRCVPMLPALSAAPPSGACKCSQMQTQHLLPSTQAAAPALLSLSPPSPVLCHPHLRRYCAAVGWPLLALVLASLALMQGSRNAADVTLSLWTDAVQHAPDSEAATNAFYLRLFTFIALLNSLLTLLRAFSFARAGMTAAHRVHRELLAAVVRAPLAFFDTNPSGRILNRFSSDLYTVDDSLPFIANILLANSFSLAGIAALLLYTQWTFLLLLLPLTYMYSIIQ
ncbi:unnamed protein product, partial [Closterium sp. Naga37s-1]